MFDFEYNKILFIRHLNPIQFVATHLLSVTERWNGSVCFIKIVFIVIHHFICATYTFRTISFNKMCCVLVMVCCTQCTVHIIFLAAKHDRQQHQHILVHLNVVGRLPFYIYKFYFARDLHAMSAHKHKMCSTQKNNSTEHTYFFTLRSH